MQANPSLRWGESDGCCRLESGQTAGCSTTFWRKKTAEMRKNLQKCAKTFQFQAARERSRAACREVVRLFLCKGRRFNCAPSRVAAHIRSLRRSLQSGGGGDGDSTRVKLHRRAR